MILLQTMKWFGPSRHSQQVDPHEKRVTIVHEPETLASRLTLSAAIAAMSHYSDEFKRVYGRHTGVEYTLIGVQYLPEDLTDDDLENANLLLIDTMSDSLKDEPTYWEVSP